MYSILCPILLIFLGLREIKGRVEWSNLRVTWAPDRTKLPNAFQTMPQSTFQAISEGWKALDKSDCTNGGLFNGFRFAYKNDPSYTLLYSDVGYLVGSQMNLLVDDLKKTPNVYEFDKVPAYVKNKVLGKEVYSLTAYFIDPKVICKGDPRQFFDIGSGEEFENELYFQQGRTPKKFYRVPNTRKEALRSKWSKSLCYDGMGYHSYYALETMGPTNCTRVFPYALLFNEEEDVNGQLIGFIYMGIGYCNSPRQEHVTLYGIKALMGDEAPKCLLGSQATSGICQVHNYFTDHPWTYQCPKPEENPREEDSLVNKY